MMGSRLVKTLILSLTLFASACAADSDSSDQTALSAEHTIIRMMPLHRPDAKVDAAVNPAIAGLTNFGGPVLKNISVHPVYWNSTTKFQANLNAFYPAVVGSGSALWAMLAQYGIGFGTAVAGFIDNKATANVTDSAVQIELNRLFAAGALPLPNANTYYPVHFPSGMTITAPDGSRSCVQFCGYHSTYVRGGVNVYYGIIPDIGQTGCAGGCGGSTVQNNTDSVASHELVEAATDPAVGLATVFGPPLGWYDQVDNAEIGDLCNGQQGTAAGFVVQKEWSNAARACVVN